MIRRGMRSEIFLLFGIFFLFVLFRLNRRKLVSSWPSAHLWGGLGQERLFNIPGADRVLSPSLPRRGNWLARAVGRLSYKLTGWRVEGQLPDVPKLVLVGAPHTSYWDAPLAIGFFFATGLDCRWMAKKEAFKQPLGGLIRRMGAIPVNRQDPGNLVQQVIDEMNRSEKFVLIITPEGSRTKVERWKTGFYRIALATGTPITLVYADFARRVVGVGPTYRPTGDIETQIEEMRAFYRGITARNPDWA